MTPDLALPATIPAHSIEVCIASDIGKHDFWYSTVPQSKMVVKLQAAEMSRSRESLKACLTTARRCGTSVNIVLAYAREFRLWTAHTPKAVPKR